MLDHFCHHLFFLVLLLKTCANLNIMSLLLFLLLVVQACTTPNLNFLLPLLSYPFCHAWLPLLPLLLLFSVTLNLMFLLYSLAVIFDSLPCDFSFLLLLLKFCAILKLIFRLSLLLLVPPCCHAWLPSPPLFLLILLKPFINIHINKACPKYIRWMNLPLFPCFLSHFTGSLFNLRWKKYFHQRQEKYFKIF